MSQRSGAYMRFIAILSRDIDKVALGKKELDRWRGERGTEEERERASKGGIICSL